jgi:cytochrome c biogenesis protein CcmG/thiol:disulfide interchange protein DsbE
MPSRSNILFALLACVVVLAGCGGGDAGNPESKAVDYKAALADAPPKLAALYRQGDALVPAGLDAYERELRRLDGTPVVVNLWASWCGPCRFEFPVFQDVSAKLGDAVAFLGVDTLDNDDAARTFLDQLPVPYPSITDPDREVWDELKARGVPATAFYDSSGELVYLHQGPYESSDDLTADIERYAR